MTIDPFGASGAIFVSIWTDAKIPVTDELCEDFLNYVKGGMNVSVKDGGLVGTE